MNKSVEIPISKNSEFNPLLSTSIPQELGAADEIDDKDGYYKYKIGEIIEHYQVTDFHGKGSFGIVLEAIDLRPEADKCKVAIKMAKNNDVVFEIIFYFDLF